MNSRNPASPTSRLPAFTFTGHGPQATSRAHKRSLDFDLPSNKSTRNPFPLSTLQPLCKLTGVYPQSHSQKASTTMHPQALDPAFLHYCSHRTPPDAAATSQSSATLPSALATPPSRSRRPKPTSPPSSATSSSPLPSALPTSTPSWLAWPFSWSRTTFPLAAPPSWLTSRTSCSVPCRKSTAKTTPAASPQTRRPSGPIRRRASNGARGRRSMRRCGID